MNAEKRDEATPEGVGSDAASAPAAEAGTAAPAEPGPAAAEDAADARAAEVADLKDRLLRQIAETENLRRRNERELADARRYAVADFARDLLEVHDNLQRALSSVPEEQRDGAGEMKTVLEGVAMTERELTRVLDRHGVKTVEAQGLKLDPNRHQAVMQVDDPTVEPGTVVQVLQQGFTIHDRLLRAAMVAVATGGQAKPAGGGEGATPPRPGGSVDVEA